MKNALFCGILFLVAGCATAPLTPWEQAPTQAGVVERELKVMETSFKVRLWTEREKPAVIEAIFAEAFAEIRRVARIADEGDAKSELSKLNALAFAKSIVASPELFSMIELGQKMTQRSGGVFDVTFLPIQAETEKYGPDAGLTGGVFEFANDVGTQVKTNVGASHLQLTPASRSVRFGKNGMKVGIRGIAKGWAVQKAADRLTVKRLKGFAVLGGGTVVAAGAALRDPSLMCIEHPSELGTCVYRVVPRDLSQPLAMAVSASAGRPGHIYHPKSGLRKARAGGVTIIARHAAWAQAAATAAGLMDNRRTEAFLALPLEPKIAGVFFDSEYSIELHGTLDPFAQIGKAQ